MEELKNSSWFSKGQELETVRVLWSAHYNIYFNADDLAGREKISTFKDDVSKEWRIIASMDADVDVTLRDVTDIAKEVVVEAEIEESADVQGRKAESQAQIYQIDIEYADKKLDKEVAELKRHLQIVPNDEDDVYIEATPLARKVPVVDYEIYTKNNKPYYKIIRADGSSQLFLSFLSLL
nr:hypothetical protein [Tanacetum cinerariifolium]